MKWIGLLLACATMGATAFAAPPVVVEMFASNNCNNSKVANETLRELDAENSDVLILTWSVDYWDYLGTPDPMAMPFAKERQAAYNERLGLRAPYTPQTVYDGAVQCPATQRGQVDKNIDKRMSHSADEPALELVKTATGFSASGMPASPLEILVVNFLPRSNNETPLANPVTKVESLGLWKLGSVSHDVACELACAVLLQEPDHGEIKAVLRLK